MSRMTDAGHARQASENSEYLRRLLAEKQPEFLAVLQAAERQVDAELLGEPCAERHIRAWLRDAC
jgi:hypothetical protein